MITEKHRRILKLIEEHPELKFRLFSDPKYPPDAIVLKGDTSSCPYLAISNHIGDKAFTNAVGAGCADQEFYAAADNDPGHDPELRKLILKACRL